MARLYSSEWVDAFNAAVADLSVDTSTADSLVASSGRFSVTQTIADGPDGPLAVTLVVADGRCALELGAVGSPEVTVSLPYADAAALSRGDLDIARALGSGRIRVKGDLSVLVAAQELLAAAGERLGDLREATTY